jgi:hypothetical protein
VLHATSEFLKSTLPNRGYPLHGDLLLDAVTVDSQNEALTRGIAPFFNELPIPILRGVDGIGEGGEDILDQVRLKGRTETIGVELLLE